MGRLLTAPAVASSGDYGHADQDRELLTPETKYLCLVHPPFFCIKREKEGKLWGLEPPDKLTQDFQSEIVKSGKFHQDVWDEVDFENRYTDHIESDNDAQQDIFTITAILNGSDVCLLCMEHTDKWCIRRLIREHLQETGQL